MKDNSPKPLKTMSKFELAEAYNVSVRTLSRWIEKIREKEPLFSSKWDKYLPPKDVSILREKLGDWD